MPPFALQACDTPIEGARVDPKRSPRYNSGGIGQARLEALFFSDTGLDMVKAVALFSGGLDSILAVRVVQEQGVEVEGLHFTSIFCRTAPDSTTCNEAEESAKLLGLPLTVYDSSQDLLELVRNPGHGYGKHLNPCIDCRISMFRKAAAHMRNVGARFLVTGEIRGQRPMSQRRDTMVLIDREAGVEGLVLRPLSAKTLVPTMPEKEGWVEREKLLDISGRSRTRQMELAGHFDVGEYPTPSGGCLLTYESFADKVRDLIEHGEFNVDNVELLKYGRYYRAGAKTTAVIGRNHEENEILTGLARNGDRVLQAVDFNGPLTLLRGEGSEDALRMAAELTARYSQGRDARVVRIRVKQSGAQDEQIVEVAPADLEKYRHHLFT